RKFDELQEGMGLFAKWIPLDCRVESTTSFDELLRRADESVQEALAWEEFFICDPDASPLPLLDESLIGFEYIEWPARRHSAGVVFSAYRQYFCIDQFKLKIRSTRFKDSLHMEFLFDPDVIPGDYVSRLASQCRILIKSICDNPRA